MAIRYKIAVARKDWETILRLADRYGETVPESERLLTRAFKLVARAELATPKEAQHILEMEHGEFCRDTRASIILCQSARSLGLEDLSQSLFESAVSASQDGDVDFPSRLSIAGEAMVRGQSGVAVDALNGRVALDRESEELRLLAHGHVVDVPIRERAIRFFDDLNADIRGTGALSKAARHFAVQSRCTQRRGQAACKRAQGRPTNRDPHVLG